MNVKIGNDTSKLEYVKRNQMETLNLTVEYLKKFTERGEKKNEYQRNESVPLHIGQSEKEREE